MLHFDQIVSIMEQRRNAQEPLIRSMIAVKQRYGSTEDNWIIPYSGDEDVPELPPLTPTIIAEAIDFPASRAASVMPLIYCPALDPAKDTGVKSLEFAMKRRKAIVSTYRHSNLNLGLRRAYRHLGGYATTALVVEADLVNKRPRILVRDPLTTYPEAKAPEDLSPPDNCGFVYAKSGDWLRAAYPESRAEVGGCIPADPGPHSDNLWDVIEWIDADHIVVGIMGPADQGSATNRPSFGTSSRSMELRRWVNKAGRCTVVTPRRVTLAGISSQIAHITGIVDLMARLQALNIMATEKSIFPDRYALGDGTGNIRLIGDEWKDGRTGEINLVDGARSIGELRGTPDPTNMQQIDRLERNARISTGLVPQAGGETYGSLRTGRGMDSMMSAAVDPRVQELQEIMQASLEHVNAVALDTFKGYWPTRTFHLFTGKGTDNSVVEFVPEKHAETTENSVQYAMAGADVQGVTIQIGQLLGMKLMSERTARQRHPFIDDPDSEEKRIEEEVLQHATLESIISQAQGGQIPPTYLAKLALNRRKQPTIFEAVEATDAELRAEQAKEAPPPEEGQHAPPEQMPGLAPPGAGPVPPMGAPPEMPSMPGDIGAPGQLKDVRRMIEALSSRPPVQPPAPQGAPV